MRIGVFADTHDHVENLARLVEHFNHLECELVAFAGDLVSTFVIPKLRRLRCPILGTFGDNEGNKTGILGGFEILGTIGEPPLGTRLADGTRLLITHQKELLLDLGECEIVVFAHTHRPAIRTDQAGRLWVNPGEASGWTYGQPSFATIETTTLQAEIRDLHSGHPQPLDTFLGGKNRFQGPRGPDNADDRSVK